MLIVFCLPLVLAERLSQARLTATSPQASTQPPSQPGRAIHAATPVDALLLGLAQSVALIPGVSRSGITIAAGMLRGFRREEAASLTFLLSAPIIAAAGGKQVFDIATGNSESGGAGYAVYAAGLITAGVVGYAAIAFLLRYLRRGSLYLFVCYRLIIGISVLGLVAAGAL
jgi:undecaprenyl-diphosphatase